MSELTEVTPIIRGGPEHVNAINSSGRHWPASPDFPRTYEEYVRPVLAELMGTMLFVCMGVLCVQYAGSGMGTSASVYVCIAVGHGLTIALLVTALGDLSGAHVNPAVTLGIMLAEAISPAKAVLYIIAQLAGSLLGAGLSKAILPSHLYEAIGGGAHTLGAGTTPGQGVLCEVVLTTLLVLIVLLSAVDPKTKSSLAPLAIGFAVTVDILAGARLTGASMNPARSFGPAVVISSQTSQYWQYHYIYWAGPFLGSLVASIWYRLLFASEEKRLVFRSSENRSN